MDYLLVDQINNSVRSQLLVILLVEQYLNQFALAHSVELRHDVRIVVQIFPELRLKRILRDPEPVFASYGILPVLLLVL